MKKIIVKNPMTQSFVGKITATVDTKAQKGTHYSKLKDDFGKCF